MNEWLYTVTPMPLSGVRGSLPIYYDSECFASHLIERVLHTSPDCTLQRIRSNARRVFALPDDTTAVAFEPLMKKLGAHGLGRARLLYSLHWYLDSDGGTMLCSGVDIADSSCIQAFLRQQGYDCITYRAAYTSAERISPPRSLNPGTYRPEDHSVVEVRPLNAKAFSVRETHTVNESDKPPEFMRKIRVPMVVPSLSPAP